MSFISYNSTQQQNQQLLSLSQHQPSLNQLYLNRPPQEFSQYDGKASNLFTFNPSSDMDQNIFYDGIEDKAIPHSLYSFSLGQDHYSPPLYNSVLISTEKGINNNILSSSVEFPIEYLQQNSQLQRNDEFISDNKGLMSYNSQQPLNYQPNNNPFYHSQYQSNLPQKCDWQNNQTCNLSIFNHVQDSYLETLEYDKKGITFLDPSNQINNQNITNNELFYFKEVMNNNKQDPNKQTLADIQLIPQQYDGEIQSFQPQYIDFISQNDDVEGVLSEYQDYQIGFIKPSENILSQENEDISPKNPQSYSEQKGIHNSNNNNNQQQSIIEEELEKQQEQKQFKKQQSKVKSQKQMYPKSSKLSKKKNQTLINTTNKKIDQQHQQNKCQQSSVPRIPPPSKISKNKQKKYELKDPNRNKLTKKYHEQCYNVLKDEVIEVIEKFQKNKQILSHSYKEMINILDKFEDSCSYKAGAIQLIDKGKMCEFEGNLLKGLYNNLNNKDNFIKNYIETISNRKRNKRLVQEELENIIAAGELFLKKIIKEQQK